MSRPDRARPPYRGARYLTYVAAGVCAVGGLVGVYFHAVQGRVFPALVGAAVTVVSLGVGTCVLGVLRAITGVQRLRRQSSLLNQRLAAVERMLDGIQREALAATRPRREGGNGNGASEDRDESSPRLAAVEDRAAVLEAAERQWQRAYEHGDLCDCREALAVLADLCPPDVAQGLRDRLADLAQAEARRLREQFGELVRRGDFEGALHIGEKILRVVPDRRIASDFRHLQPYLAARVRDSGKAAQSSAE